MNLLRFVFEDQIEFIKESVMDGDKVDPLSLSYMCLSVKFSFEIHKWLSYSCVQYDNEMPDESLDYSRAKSALEKLQVCICYFELHMFCLLFLMGFATSFNFSPVAYWKLSAASKNNLHALILAK